MNYGKKARRALAAFALAMMLGVTACTSSGTSPERSKAPSGVAACPQDTNGNPTGPYDPLCEGQGPIYRGPNAARGLTSTQPLPCTTDFKWGEQEQEDTPTDATSCREVLVVLLLGPEAAKKLPFSLDPAENCNAAFADYTTCEQPPGVKDYAAAAKRALPKKQMDLITQNTAGRKVTWQFIRLEATTLRREYGQPRARLVRPGHIVAVNW